MVGKLVRLELFNFKSYKGHHILPFGNSYFTSIIGPNGSGKSNSMDAISFVLGISSSHLRSQQLKDLVYRGRVLKHSKINADGTAETLDEGEVNGQNGVNGAHSNGDLTASERNDPQTAWVMAVYEDEVGDTHEWKRSIKASGQSEYRINGRVVNQKQYNEALEKENILIKARNFLVFQGDVEAIASQSPKDLTKLIEQISGSGDLREEYERLKVESEKAAEDYAYRLTNRRNLNTEIKQYQEQQKEAENFERKTKDRDNAIVKHILWKLYHLQMQIEQSGADITKHQTFLKEHKRNIETYQQKYDDVKKDTSKVNRECSKLERSIKEQEREIAERSNDLDPVVQKLTSSAANVEQLQARLRSVGKERDSQSEAADHLKKSLATVEKAQQRWEKEWQQSTQLQGKQLSAADLQEYDKLRGEVTRNTGTVQVKVDNISRQFKTSEETAGSLKSRLDASNAQLERVQEDYSRLNERKTDLSTQLKQTQKDVEGKKKDLNQRSSERLRREQMRTELEEKLQDVLQRLGDAETGKRESDKEVRMRETVATMKRIFPGVRGRVHELCRPKQKKYETAVGVVLGRHWDSIVVDTESVAKDCLQYLKDNRTGQATFIPLDTIQVKQINPNLKGIHRGTRLAIDVIDYDSVYERAMAFACGTALVCDDMQAAKYVCFTKGVESTAVTLEGDKISKGGLMTGGRGKHDKPRRWDDVEVENLHKLKNKFLGEMEQLNAQKSHRRGQEEEALQGELAGLQQSLEYLKSESKSTERNLQDKKKELDFAKSQVKELSPKYKEHAAAAESLKKQLKQLRDSIGQVEDKVFGTFCKKHGYKDVREYEAQQGSLQQEAIAKNSEFVQQKNRLDNQLKFESQRLAGTNERIRRLETEVEQNMGLIKSLTVEQEEIQEEIDGFQEQLESLNTSFETAKEKALAANEKVMEAKRTLQKRARDVDETLKKISEIETEIQRSNANRVALLKKCRIEEIKIPLTDDSEPLSVLPLGDVSADADAMDVDVDETSGQVEEVLDYGIDVDYDSLEDKLTRSDSPETEQSLLDVVSNLNSELEKMAPNMRATDRLNDVAVRLESTEKELESARRQAKRAKDDFEQVKEDRLELFNKAYEHITEQIERVYVDLTKSSTTPLGGKAYLDTEEPDEPYLAGIKYHAMPPLKRFRDMEHLSGGEKTMAALALLFAIHSFQPSPFFVLDEVDAALDNANVAKLVNYIKNNARPGMQFIVISLKPTFFEGSQTLVGVMRDQSANSSKTLTLDLRQYQP